MSISKELPSNSEGLSAAAMAGAAGNYALSPLVSNVSLPKTPLLYDAATSAGVPYATADAPGAGSDAPAAARYALSPLRSTVSIPKTPELEDTPLAPFTDFKSGETGHDIEQGGSSEGRRSATISFADRAASGFKPIRR